MVKFSAVRSVNSQSCVSRAIGLGECISFPIYALRLDEEG